MKRLNDAEYLESLERLAKDVMVKARKELSETPDDKKTELQKAIIELGHGIRYMHYKGDGCLEHD